MQVLGIEPEDLIQKGYSEFTKARPGDKTVVPKHISKVRYEHHLNNIRSDKEAIIKYKVDHFKE